MIILKDEKVITFSKFKEFQTGDAAFKTPTVILCTPKRKNSKESVVETMRLKISNNLGAHLKQCYNLQR